MIIVKKSKNLDHPDICGKRALDYAIENQLYLKCEVLVKSGANIFSNSFKRMPECEYIITERKKFIGKILL